MSVAKTSRWKQRQLEEDGTKRPSKRVEMETGKKNVEPLHQTIEEKETNE